MLDKPKCKILNLFGRQKTAVQRANDVIDKFKQAIEENKLLEEARAKGRLIKNKEVLKRYRMKH